MIYALITIALVQSLGFASEMRLALGSDGLNHGDRLDKRDWLDGLTDRLLRSGLPLLRLRLLPQFTGFQDGFPAGSLEKSESQPFRQSGREIWQYFASATPC